MDTATSTAQYSRVDSFSKTISGVFQSLGTHTRTLLILLGAVILLSVGAGFWLTHNDEKTARGMSALYVATKGLDAEEAKLNPPTPVSPEQTAKGAKKPAPVADDATFRKLDVGTVFQTSVASLEKVAHDYSGTRVAMEASQRLGDLYFRHGQWVQAGQWFASARSSASRSLDVVAALAGQAYSLENQGKLPEASALFEEALKKGEEPWKGDLLLGLARTQVGQGKSDAAKATYERILKEVPGTESARQAEWLKNQTSAHP